jgi:hypothetical protein
MNNERRSTVPTNVQPVPIPEIFAWHILPGLQKTERLRDATTE